MGQIIQAWTKWNLWKTAFIKFEVIWSALAHQITSNFLKAVFHKFQLVHPWILTPIFWSSTYFCRWSRISETITFTTGFIGNNMKNKVYANFNWLESFRRNNPTGIYLLKDNNKNIKIRCEICSKLTIKAPERRQWRLKPASKTAPWVFSRFLNCKNGTKSRKASHVNSKSFTIYMHLSPKALFQYDLTCSFYCWQHSHFNYL